MPPSARLLKRRRSLSWKKEPDLVLGFGNLRYGSIPRLLVEVGFSEPKQDLIDDAVEWLCRQRRVTAVILIDINEDDRALAQTQHSDDFLSRLQTLQSRYGNTDLEDSAADSDSGQTLYIGLLWSKTGWAL
jgi:hypothetical protein